MAPARTATAALAALALSALIGAAGAADDWTVDATRRGSSVDVDARATVRAPLVLIWETLTDYENLPRFVPGIRSSRVLQRQAAATVVHQQGEAGFLIFSSPIDVVVESLERPPDTIGVRLISGNLKQLAGAYRIEPGPAEGTFVLRWQGLIEPASLPPLIGLPLLRHTLREQFLGMVREIERRAAEQAPRDGRGR